MLGLRLLPLILSALLLAAHFFRGGHLALVGLALAVPFLWMVPRPWARPAVRAALVLGGLEWVRALAGIAQVRRSHGEPWERMAIILGGVALLALFAAAVLPRRGRSVARPPDLAS